MDEPAEAHVADNRPAKFDDLLLGVVEQQVIEEFLADVAVVDEQPFRVGEGGFLRIAEVLVAPRPNLCDGFFFQRLESP